MDTKKCSMCKKVKDVSEFWKDKAQKSGIRCRCKKCIKEDIDKNKDKIKITKHKSYIKYRKKNIEYSINHRTINIEKAKIREKKYHKKRRKIDPVYKLKTAIRSNISYAIKRGGYKKTSSTSKILGCTWEEFRKWIENKFTENMSWDNYGMHGWHLDHIIPISSGKTKKEVLALNHYKNFQPLWAKDNISKGNKMPY